MTVTSSRPAERLLRRLSGALAREGRPDAVVRVALDALVAEMGAQAAAVFLNDEPAGVVRPVYSVNYPEDVLAEISAVGRTSPAISNLAMQTGDVHTMSLSSDEPEKAYTRNLGERIGVVSAAAVPLMASGRTLGVLVYGLAHEHSFDDEELELLREVGDRIAEALERTRLEAALTRRAEEAELLQAILTAASGEDDLGRILSSTLDRLKGLINFTGGSIALVEEDDLVVRAADGVFAAQAVGQRLPRGRGRTWKVIESDEPFFTNDLQADGYRSLTNVAGQTLRSYIAAPLIWRGHAFGLLEVDSIEPNAFRSGDPELIRSVATALSGPIELARRYADEVRLREELDHAKGELEAALADRDRFMSIASHELRTPLTSIRAAAQLLNRVAETDSLTRDILTSRLQTIVAQTDRLRELVSDLLDVTRIRSGRLELQPKDTELVDITRRAIATFPERARARVHLDAPSALTGCWDADRMLQVITNLIDNALKYSDPSASVDVTLCDAGDAAVLSVTDHGIGIPDANLPHLFDAFARAENAVRHDQSGLGLGLFICRQIVELHGGTITVNSIVGSGSTFNVRLPRGT